MTDEETKKIIADMYQKISDLVTRQAAHATESSEMKDDIKKLMHVILEGNGTPPMTVRLALLEAEAQRVKEERADEKMPRAAWVAIVVSVLLGVGSMVVTLAS